MQQIVLKATVAPWNHSRHIHADAFRTPLRRAFDLVETINAFQYRESVLTDTHQRLHAPLHALVSL